MTKITLITAIAMVAFTTNVVAQASVENASTATVVAPIGIAAGNDLAFGNLAVVELGTVVLTPAGARSATGGVTSTTTGTFSPAGFTVTGESSYAYTLTLPGDSDVLLTDDVGTGLDMTVTTFTSSLTALGGTIGTEDAFTVGATLNVGAGQEAGAYAGVFNVTVEYD